MQGSAPCSCSSQNHGMVGLEGPSKPILGWDTLHSLKVLQALSNPALDTSSCSFSG